MFQTFINRPIFIHIIYTSSVKEEAVLINRTNKRELYTSFTADRDTEQK